MQVGQSGYRIYQMWDNRDSSEDTWPPIQTPQIESPMGTNCAPFIADLFFYCYEKDFMSNLHKSKKLDLVDKFNDTSRYLDDILTIDNPELNISPIYTQRL